MKIIEVGDKIQNPNGEIEVIKIEDSESQEVVKITYKVTKTGYYPKSGATEFLTLTNNV